MNKEYNKILILVDKFGYQVLAQSDKNINLKTICVSLKNQGYNVFLGNVLRICDKLEGFNINTTLIK